MIKQKQIKKDEWAIVLDFLSHGHHGMDRSQPVAQVMGEDFFSLLEVIIRNDVSVNIRDRLYIGDGKRNEVKYIRGRIGYTELTVASKQELIDIIEYIVEKNQERFINFFNKSGQLTTRLHQLELLPGIGKKHLWAIIDARKEREFKSFDEMKKRVPLLPDPEKMIVKRIIEEIEDKDKHRVFVPRIESKSI
ncbi:MAG: DUF655 domain-containing protein [Nanoarchaeota archaeon]|nr:DUF655 domain-containing protein [Nanoarchaeota archaeon]